MKVRRAFAPILFVFTFFAFDLMCMNAHAQDKEMVLANGNPPLTQSMVNKATKFLEWTLDINLSPAQLSQVQKILIQCWTTGNAMEIKGTLDIISVYEQLMQLNAPERNAMKEELQKLMMQNIQSDPDDDLSKLLLSALASKVTSKKVAADSVQWASPAKSKLRVGTDGFTGLYRMLRPKMLNINSTYPESGYYIEHIVFLPGGKLYRSLPPEGLLYFDLAVVQRTDAADCGSYEFKNEEIHIFLGPAKTPYVITRNGERLNNPPSLGTGSFRPVPNCDGLKLEGDYHRHESEPAITFARDGKFTDGGIFRYFGTMAKPDGTLYNDDGIGGSGIYVIEQNTLELRYSDGRIKRVAFQAFPENLAKKPAVPSFLLREERFERF